MKSDYIFKRKFESILDALTLENRIALEVSLHTGLRISDVLNLRSCKLSARMTIRELKTLKNKKIRINVELLEQMYSIAGKVFVFEGRNDPKKPRTRQAVYKDIKRACECFRIKNLQISPHTARKIYAVDKYKNGVSISKIRELLNHSSEAVTMLYALADEISK